MKLSLLALLAFTTLSVACGDNDLDAGSETQAATKPVTLERLDQFCTKNVDRSLSCNPQSNNTVAECKQDNNCFADAIRTDAVEPLLQCLEARPCGKSDDACFAEVGKSFTLSDKGKSYESACLAKLSECGKGDGGFSDDFCTDGDVPWRLLTDRYYDSLAPCFSKVCGEISACLKNSSSSVARSLCTDPSLTK